MDKVFKIKKKKKMAEIQDSRYSQDYTKKKNVWMPPVHPQHKCRQLSTPSIGVAWALGLRLWIETKAQMMVKYCVDFSYCWLNLEE